MHPDAGIIEPVTLDILNYLSYAGDQADSWISAAVHVSSVSLFSRIHTSSGFWLNSIHTK